MTINDEKLVAVQEAPTTLYIEENGQEAADTPLETIPPDAIPDWETIPDEDPVSDGEVTTDGGSSAAHITE